MSKNTTILHKKGPGKRGSFTLAFHNLANLGLKSHVQHAIGFVKNEVVAELERDHSTLQEINQPARGGDKELATPLKVTNLVVLRSSSINHTSANK